MTETAPISLPAHKYSRGFKIASAFSGCSTFLVLIGVPVYSDPISTGAFRCIVAFCIIAYPFLQFSCALHQRQNLKTVRARIYFWLLALFPVWSIPIALLTFEAIWYVMKRA